MLIMISVINIGNKVFGYRILDTESKEYMDIPRVFLRKMIQAGKSIENIKLDGGKIKGFNGNIDRYTHIDLGNKKPIGRESLVILYRTTKESYIVSNYYGIIIEMGVSELLNYNIANGKVHNCSRISPICGKYKLISSI